jgi:hypothetical protein
MNDIETGDALAALQAEVAALRALCLRLAEFSGPTHLDGRPVSAWLVDRQAAARGNSAKSDQAGK